jgi:hypothetical protein
MNGRMVRAEEARTYLAAADAEPFPSPLSEGIGDLAHTVVVQAEQIAAVLALHQPREEADGRRTDPWCEECDGVVPCDTVRSLGVTA